MLEGFVVHTGAGGGLHDAAAGAASAAAADRWRAAPHPGAVHEVRRHATGMCGSTRCTGSAAPPIALTPCACGRYRATACMSVCCRAQKKALIKFHPDRYQSASVAVQVTRVIPVLHAHADAAVVLSSAACLCCARPTGTTRAADGYTCCLFSGVCTCCT
jgi:hypothetical protein